MSADFVDFLLDQLAAIERLRSRRMFGGHSLSVDGVTFALIIRDLVYFAVDEHSRARYLAMNSRCFSYETAKRRVNVERYYEVPGELLEDQDALLALAREALAVAARPRPAKTRTKVHRRSPSRSGPA